MKNKVFMVGMIIMVMMLAQFSMLIGSVKAETITGSDGDVSWSFDSESGILTFSGSGEITGNWRTEIDLFEEKVNKVVIQNGITTLGQFAFQNCKSMKSIDIPNSVEVIEGNAFVDCESLTSITIPDKIGEESEGFISSWFVNCKSLENVDVSSNNKYYSSVDGVVYNKDKTKLIYYPWNKSNTSYKILEGVTSIGEAAFADCEKLTSIDIPNSVSNIETDAFIGCVGITSIKIPNGVKSVEPYTFCGCQSLTYIEIPNSVTIIGDDAFWDCDSLKEVKIPNSVTSIGNGAFLSCDNLTKMEVPNSVTTIGRMAFTACENLKEIKISNSVTSIGVGAFGDCKSLTYIQIPNSVINIGESAFANCLNLTKIAIPSSVTSIGDNAFAYCDNLTIYCKSNSDAQKYAEENNINYVIDDNAPTITALKQEDKYINITATDNNGVGLAYEAYSLDNKNWSSSNKIAVEKSGTYTVYVRDMLDNTATETIDVVIIEDSNKSGKDDNASGKNENGDADKTTNSETDEPKKSDIKTSTETTNVEKNTEDKTQAKTVIPQAGATFPVIIFTAISIIGFVCYKKFKKINY